MSAQQFIVDRLNEPPFGMRLTLVAFDEKSPFELLEIVNDTLQVVEDSGGEGLAPPTGVRRNNGNGWWRTRWR